MADTLKPCPGCGAGQNLLIYIVPPVPWPQTASIRCSSCGFQAPDATTWNRRADPRPPLSREEIEAAIREHCVLASADIAQGIDGSREAADAVLALIGGRK